MTAQPLPQGSPPIPKRAESICVNHLTARYGRRKRGDTSGVKTLDTSKNKTLGTSGGKTLDTSENKTLDTSGGNAANKVGAITILDDVTLEVRRGELVALIGPNGSGKSTLLAIMAGVSPISHPSLAVDGDVMAQGEPLLCMKAVSRAKIVSFMAQSERSAWNYSALEVVRMARYASCHGHYTKCDDAAALQALSLAGAEDLAGRGVNQLSLGQWQRVRLARAVAQNTPFMILDEPDTALDMGFCDEFLSILQALSHKRAVGVLFSTHDVNAAARYCDRLALLDCAGRVQSGDVQSMMTSSCLTRLYGRPIGVAEDSALGKMAYVM